MTLPTVVKQERKEEIPMKRWASPAKRGRRKNAPHGVTKRRGCLVFKNQTESEKKEKAS